MTKTYTRRRRRASSQSRKPSVHKISQSVSRPILSYDTENDAATLLGMLVRDRRLGHAALFRLMMCAGASPHDLFDAEGRAHQTARSIVAQLLAHRRAPEFVPQCPREVEAWLKTAEVTAKDVREACKGDRSSRTTHRRSASRSTDDAAEAAALTEQAAPGDDLRVLLHVAAMYLVVRAHRALPRNLSHKVPKTALTTRLIADTQSTLPDMPRLQASEDYRPDKQKTYETTDDCLKGVHDDGLRALFVEHTTLTALRKHLLLRRKPVFFHRRRLMNEHLIRPDGTPRTSIAEIAYAIKHEWDNKSVVDAAVSKFAAMMRRIGKAFA